MVICKHYSIVGLWRVQVDHVCDHLKAHALSSQAFQNDIASPVMGKVYTIDMQAAFYQTNLLQNLDYSCMCFPIHVKVAKFVYSSLL